MKLAIDSTYLIRLLRDEDMKDLAELIQDEEIEAVVAPLSLVEVYSVLARRDKARAMSYIGSLWASKLQIPGLTPSTITLSGDLRNDYHLHLSDAIIAATGITSGARHILTDDAHFKSVRNRIKPLSLKQCKNMFLKEGLMK
jgi:predicted nucleic acid-binding protein